MNLKAYLTEKNIKQIELAHRLGTTPSLISLAVNGWVKLPKKYRKPFCDFLKISEQDLNKMQRREEWV